MKISLREFTIIFISSSCAVLAYHFVFVQDNSTAPEKALDIYAQTTNSLDHSELKLRIERLQQQLFEEQQSRQALEYELELVEKLIPQNANNTAPPHRPKASSDIWFDEKSLIDLGISPYEVADIKAIYDQVELKKLTLRNQASRLGRQQSGKNYREIQRLSKQLQTELGEENYDRMLYATQQNNRVQISDTLPNSAAANAGIKKGDIILSYGEDKIYNPTSLFLNTSKGELGEMINVEILRAGERINLYVPRGPLGTRFKPTRDNPEI